MSYYLQSLTFESVAALGERGVEISFVPDDNEPFIHLLLTGPNGSGKSTLLRLLAADLFNVVSPRFDRLGWLGPSEDARLRTGAFLKGSSIMAYLGAMRQLSIERVEGPKKLSLGPTLPGETLASQFLQFLVNRKAEQGFASVDQDEAKVAALKGWFDNLQQQLRELFAEEDLTLTFDSQEFNFYLAHPDGRRFDFTQLADGHAAVLSIYAELLLRLEGAPEVTSPDGLAGIVLIDELETHLHVELQEKILPFLTGVFPKIQFIVATHSPIILSSVENAVIYDLESKRSVRSKEYRAIPYGALMKGHFGIESDFDLSSTRKLRELMTLNQKMPRSPEEGERLAALAEELVPTAHPLVLEVWNRVQFPELYEGRGVVNQGVEDD